MNDPRPVGRVREHLSPIACSKQDYKLDRFLSFCESKWRDILGSPTNRSDSSTQRWVAYNKEAQMKSLPKTDEGASVQVVVKSNFAFIQDCDA